MENENKEKWYDNDITRGVMKAKYFHEGETEPDQLLHRVANAYSDDIKDEVYDRLERGEILPAGRTLFAANADPKIKVSASNCYISESPEDTLNSIFNIARDCAIIGSRGGGVGICLSNLRPSGCTVNNSVKFSTGIKSFLKLYNQTGEIIGQMNRHMAMMIALDVWHPDVFEFMDIKHTEKLSAANISLKLDDKFMKAVKADTDYELHFDVKSTGEKIRRNVKARSIWKSFCKYQHEYGDPGALFINRIKSYNLLSGYPEYKIEVSNPCVTGDTLILTDHGYERIVDRVGKPTIIWNGYQFSEVTPMVTGHNQKMKRVTLSNGMSLDCTWYHKFIMEDGYRIEAKDMRVGDKLAKWEYPILQGCRVLKHAYTQGFYSGDGTIGLPEITLYGVKQNLLDKLSTRIFHAGENRTLVKLTEDVKWDKVFVPSNLYTIQSRLEWLAGIIDSDGSLNDVGGSISISSIDPYFLKLIQRMLTTLGCHSSIGLMHDECYKYMPLNDGMGGSKTYFCQKSYRLVISAFNVVRLIQLGLRTYRVELVANPNRDASRFIRVVSIEDIPNEETVYCFTEPINHSGIFNGIMTAQCGEYLANAGNSCLLQSINVYRFVDNKFTKDANVNYKELEKCATFCVKMMNQTQVFGYGRQPLDINRENIDEWCSIGLGVMGLGDMFVALGIKYGEKKSIDIAKEIMHTIFRGAVIGSALVAKETKKTFGKYEWEKTKKSPLLKKLARGKDVDKYAYEMVRKYGLANGSLISIAPTGSISLAAGGFSGGVEPLYKVSYIRTTHSAEDKEKKFFFRVFSKGVYDLLRHDGIDPESLNNDEIVKRYPFIAESHEIDYNDRIKMQSAMQIWTDNAISSTVNLKHEATVEDISDIYLKAWAAGLKGITVFRDNCGGRENILDAKEDEKQEEIIENGILDNNKVKKLDFIKPMKRRNVRVLNAVNVRNDTACVNGFYTTIDSTEDGHVFDLFVDTRSGCKTNIQAISGLISLATRSGVRIEEIINELKLHTCRNCQDGIKKGKDISLSCPIAIAESLNIAYKDLKKKHPEHAEKNVTPKKDIATTKKKIEHIKIGDPSLAECPECHEHTLIPEGKCVRCPNCGYSAC